MVYGIVYDPSGKGIMAPMEYTLMVYSHSEKSMVKRYGQKIQCQPKLVLCITWSGQE